MRFRQLVRTVDTNNCYECMIEPNKLKAQYNPERFHFWQRLHNGPPNKVLHMRYSPHYRLLRTHTGPYRQLQKYYGRNDKWINNKIIKFIDIYESIKKEGFLENISALETPLVKNKYNRGYEIYEGHHRVAIALVLGLDTIPCDIIRR